MAVGAAVLQRLLQQHRRRAVVLSGGYGVVLAREPIGRYEAVLDPSWWPNSILQRVLTAYATANGINAVRAFAATSTGYSKILRTARWRNAAIPDALLISPEAAAGAMVKSPASIGEALNAFSVGELSEGWKSSYGLGLGCQRIR